MNRISSWKPYNRRAHISTKKDILLIHVTDHIEIKIYIPLSGVMLCCNNSLIIGFNQRE